MKWSYSLTVLGLMLLGAIMSATAITAEELRAHLSKGYEGTRGKSFHWEVEREFKADPKQAEAYEKLSAERLSKLDPNDRIEREREENRRRTMLQMASAHTIQISYELRFLEPETYYCRQVFPGTKPFEVYVDKGTGCSVSGNTQTTRPISDGAQALGNIIRGSPLFAINQFVSAGGKIDSLEKREGQLIASFSDERHTFVATLSPETLVIEKLVCLRGKWKQYEMVATYKDGERVVPSQTVVTVFDSPSEQTKRIDTWRLIETRSVEWSEVKTIFSPPPGYGYTTVEP